MTRTTQLTTSDDPTTFVVTEVTTLAEIIRKKEDILSQLPVLLTNLLHDVGQHVQVTDWILVGKFFFLSQTA